MALISPSIGLVLTDDTIDIDYSIGESLFTVGTAPVNVKLVIKDNAAPPVAIPDTTTVYSGTVVNFVAEITNTRNTGTDDDITLTTMTLTVPPTSSIMDGATEKTVTMKFLNPKGYSGTDANPTTLIAVTENTGNGTITITFPDSTTVAGNNGKYYAKFNGIIDYSIA